MAELPTWARLPVRIYVDPGGASTDQLRAACLVGMDEWAAATIAVVSYQTVGSAANADMMVHMDDLTFLTVE